ncbi:hypothetical protein LOSG293_080190 [Secundilactobacillus oryzae JCM 18671]|uniref:DUF1097 domain-containing protein n=1 Tax=Secundilactobacillus oryzae JCM 18671 TaxID=1291743 RepID=A0A081BHL5_9LACO|nr:DUF1097 domain-containing protein [Secundilactobacillus oryzae]GAK47533.1 hypothetical protein LOSG293_080190 [Secundilactobacillus oryzae JCM 18671]
MKIPKIVWFDSIGVGLFTFIYSLIMTGFSLWMGAAAFIAVSFFFGAGFPKDKIWNIIASFIAGIIWGLIAYNLLQIPAISTMWASAIMFGIMTFLALFLQGTVLKFTIVPAWLITWGTFMLIVSNIAVNNWPLFVFQLLASMLLGIFGIGYTSHYLNKWLFHLFPDKDDQSK